MLKIGCHLSVSKGYYNMGKDALSIGANVCQFFTRNPRGGKIRELDTEDINKFLELAKENNFSTLLAHAPYTINICSADKGIRRFGIDTMKDDLIRLQYIPDAMYNFHPGSHVGQGEQEGIRLIVEALNELVDEKQNTPILLETMSGKGSEIGKTFEQIAEIIEGVKLKNHIGVCMDTCHIYDGGYDIVNNLEGVLNEFDKVIGLNKLKAVHINDSKNTFGSHKDRHEKLGEGTLGISTISNIINHPKLRTLPFYLETPNELEGYAEEIKILKSLYKE